ncbi:hypothetical protein MHYP_G00153130 [Metynnis hypsauchen]
MAVVATAHLLCQHEGYGSPRFVRVTEEGMEYKVTSDPQSKLQETSQMRKQGMQFWPLLSSAYATTVSSSIKPRALTLSTGTLSWELFWGKTRVFTELN